MVASEAITIIKGIKACTDVILCELQSIQTILEITNEQFPIYERSLYTIQHSINNLLKLYSYEIPIQHALKLSKLEMMLKKIKKFSAILTKFSQWDANIIKPKCLSFEQFLFFISNPRPSMMLVKLEKTFELIEPCISELITMEETILGTAIRIEHPILQKAWLMLGGNQLKETFVKNSIIIENLYSMYCVDQNKYVPNEKYVKQRIAEFVKTIDGNAGSDPDGFISITELSFVKKTEENSKSVKALIGITDIDVFENLFPFVAENADTIEDESEVAEIMNISIPIDFKSPMKVTCSGTRTIREPLCTGYGADFNNINACEFTIPSELLPSNKHKLCGIDVECVAGDQGFGGTNQCHMRYQVNDEVTVKVFQVDRNQHPDNIYKFSIPPETIELGNIVKLWIFAPGWNGWSMTLSGVKATARFVPT